VIGFLEESTGVRSMTRLAILWLLVLTTAVVAVACWYLLRTHPPDAAVLGALATVLGALVYKGAVAIKNRNAADDDAK
jgi:hypothetical protein